jgi:cytochrome c556
MKKRHCTILSLTTLCLLLTARGRGQEPQKDEVVFMRQKLAWSQAVTEGIALEHYDQVIANAEKLMDMSQSNIWVTVKSKGYKTKTEEFQKNVNALISAARAQNTTNMLSAWASTMQNCTSCHQLFRTEQYVRDRMGKKP